MTQEDALDLCAELEDLIGDGPGEYHGCQDRIKKIQFKFNSHSNGFVREKAGEACKYLSIWRSPQKWQKWGDDPTQIKSIVRNAIVGLRLAINRTKENE